MAIRTFTLTITLNINKLNAPTKTHRLSECIKTNKQAKKKCMYTPYTLYKTPTSDLGIHIDWKWRDGKIYSIQMKLKETWSSNTPVKSSLKSDWYKRRGRQYIKIKVSIQEDITFIYSPNTGAPQHLRQLPTAIKGEISNSRGL